MYSIGLDIGSTTIKSIVLDSDKKNIYSVYERHNAKIQEKLVGLLSNILEKIGDVDVKFNITGSIGMGIAEKCNLSFIQEVIAATNFICTMYGDVSTMIDIGGEDSKVVTFKNHEVDELRMNGNCAGGTGAFIDQMSILLNVSIDELNDMALKAKNIYSIASRCGVYSKTDIQNLISKNVDKCDIAASIFHAVAIQVIVTLAHGCDIDKPILFCGGPLTFIPALRKAFVDYLNITENDIILPENSQFISAYGSALMDTKNTDSIYKLSDLLRQIKTKLGEAYHLRKGMEPIFKDENDYKEWKNRISKFSLVDVDSKKDDIKDQEYECTLGIDSGSTTTKIAVVDKNNKLLYSYYKENKGNPIEAVKKGLKLFKEECENTGRKIVITGSTSTGYGEDLIKASFRLNEGIIETIAHYIAARSIKKDVSFILDIGGQDMKAIFLDNGVINHIEINESCSSGCGSFISTFAKSLDFKVSDFAKEACKSRMPYDLGTRCTVFMNSKVKQALREGASIQDIAAGLSYSVIKNCLYKVLRLKNTNELGDNVVVQGGTMKNDSIVRAFEKLIGKEVFRSNKPELMGAIGCALYARKFTGTKTNLDEILQKIDYKTKLIKCHGCENQCLVTSYKFNNGNNYYSGNRCEKIFNNKGKKVRQGLNAYSEKLKLLFDRTIVIKNPIATLGIPRGLNMFEEYPFWYSLFTNVGIKVVLSDSSTYKKYEESVKLVMADNLCFPSKLIHSHIKNLIDKKVDRIFMPFVVYEKKEKNSQNSYNCPIVSGYSQVIKSVQSKVIPIDDPSINFKDKKLLFEQCCKYLKDFGITRKKSKYAFERALEAYDKYCQDIKTCNNKIFKDSKQRNELVILLAGRPYHSDPLIQHKLSDMIAAQGVNVITEDIVRGENIDISDVHFVSQWAYANRILKACKWVAKQNEQVQFMQMTSFGCGPDSFLLGETSDLLKRYDKTLTILKIDDVSNIGSLKLRVRSVIESHKLYISEKQKKAVEEFVTSPGFNKEDRKRKILVPFFTPFISPLIPALLGLSGYDVETLPISDKKSCDLGLRYANNEVCYPATLIVGDVVKAFKEKRYDPGKTAVAITQTGGQCRASNYISLIKKALIESGFGNVPVISINMEGGLNNNQPGFKIKWFKIIPIVVSSLLYSDCISKFYYASSVREKQKGLAKKTKEKYLNLAIKAIEENSSKLLFSYLSDAAKEFNNIINQSSTLEAPKVGLVGEIYLKFNPFAQSNISEWLIDNKIEIIPPLLLDFFIQGFVNFEINQDSGLKKKSVSNKIVRCLFKILWIQMKKVNKIGGEFKYFIPFNNIYDESKEASRVISLAAQFGEGWLLPGEIISMAKLGVNHVISLQPFGCIANHIVSKGIEKKIKQLYPEMHILSLDFDSGVSDVNVMNRLMLFIDSFK